jgi:hypothetical protein
MWIGITTVVWWTVLGVWLAETVLIGIPLLAFALLSRLGVLRQASPAQAERNRASRQTAP